jgi:flavin-dependent dehydrogenase
LNIKLEQVLENGIDEVDFIYKYKNNVHLAFDYITIKMCMRQKLDYLLVQEAQKYGIHLKTAEKVVDLDQDKGHIIVKTDKSQYNGKYLVGADGAHSIVASKFFNINKKRAMAVEGEINITPDLKVDKNRMELHYGIIPHGYGWIFPKEKVLSIGIGSFSPSLKGLNKYYYKFKKEIGLGGHQELILKAHPIPLIKEKNPVLHTGHVLLTGDAAGLVDPLCGEGIYYALQTGIWAANAIINNNLQEYSAMIQKRILPELRQADILARLIYNALPVINRLVNSDPLIAENLLAVVYGKGTYKDLFRYLINKYSIFRQALS